MTKPHELLTRLRATLKHLEGRSRARDGHDSES